MSISGRYLPELIYLTELHVQCELALRSLKALKSGIRQWDKDEASGTTYFSAPIEQVRSAHSLLTHAGIVGRFLFLGKRAGSRRKLAEPRSRRLRKLLGIRARDYSSLRRLTLRHRWEHIDERLDELFDAWSGKKLAIELVRVIPPDGKQGRIVLRGIDSKNLRIYFRNIYVEFERIEIELNDIKARISQGFKSLNEGKVKPMFPKS